MSARDKLDEILACLEQKQIKSAMTNKPTMWAYYHTMRGELLRWFDGTTDGATAGAALALIQIAARHQADPPTEAARWAAMAVYARRVFREWAPGRKLDKRSGTLGSLEWLRLRADEKPTPTPSPVRECGTCASVKDKCFPPADRACPDWVAKYLVPGAPFDEQVDKEVGRGDVTLRIEPIANLDKPTGHVASCRLPIPLSAMEAMGAFFDEAYGPDATMREEPKGWLRIELPQTKKGAGDE